MRRGRHHPRGGPGSGDHDRQPQAGDEHRALHPPAQGHARAARRSPRGSPRGNGSRRAGARPGRVPAVPDLEISVLRLDPDLPLPAYAHPGDAGADLVTTVDVTLAPGERAMVPTGGRAGAARGLRRAGPPALRARRPARPVDREHPGHHRRGLPRRDQGDADQPRPEGADRAAPGRPDRPAGRPAVRAGPVRRGRRTPRVGAWRRAVTVLPGDSASPDRTPARVPEEYREVPPQVRAVRIRRRGRRTALAAEPRTRPRGRWALRRRRRRRTTASSGSTSGRC